MSRHRNGSTPEAKNSTPRLDQYPAELKDHVMHEWDQLMKALTARQTHVIRLFLSTSARLNRVCGGFASLQVI